MVLNEFANPPEEYGEVSFFWWHGDKVTREKLHWILEQLKEKGIAGIQINYCHSDKGGQQYGLTMESDPKPFSDEWWELLAWLLEECKKYDMAFSLSDYTLGAPGQKSYMDAVLARHPEFTGQKLEWKDGHVAVARVPGSVNPMAKGLGEAVAEEFYGAFERHFPGECGKHINFFFSDELNFNIRGNLWCDDFAEEFQRRKGYDIRKKWKGIFRDIGDETPKIRLDYYDVIVALSEEAYFKPIFEWHESRGMTFGCDHGGRGQDVTEFGDYFRTMKWNQGPGNDQPRLASNIIKSKVSASISHLYRRPRVWLEGFYSSGWQTSSADVADAVFRNFGLGHNLLSLHGLYYSTHGSMWEWAPPCNHFHMPYWQEMGTLLSCTKRLSFFLSQGVHRCDVAIVYPVAAMEADTVNGESSVRTAFDMGRGLYQTGIDFDFIDFESIVRAVIQDGKLCVAGEEYEYVILPDMKNVRFSMLAKLAEFAESGGSVIVVGNLPEGSDRIGRNDPELDRLCGIISEKGKLFGKWEDAADCIRKNGKLDFYCRSEGVFFQHRVMEGRDCYYLYGVEKNRECRFRACGIPVLLNPWSGERRRIRRFEKDTEGTTLIFPLTEKDPVCLVFEQENEETLALPFLEECEERWKPEGEWECEMLPTMDNRYGDYRIPVEDMWIKAEAREARYCVAEEELQNDTEAGEWKQEWFSYGEYFWVCEGQRDREEEFVEMKTPLDGFVSKVVSMKYGVKGDAGYQGSYHGLKGMLSDEFITLGQKKLTQAGSSSVYEGEGGYYVFLIFYSEQAGMAFVSMGGIKPDSIWVNHRKAEGERISLNEGSNYVLLRYGSSGRTFFTLLKRKGFLQSRPLVTRWFQNQDMVLLDPYPEMAGKLCWYRFTAPPGIKEIHMSTIGETRVYINGKELEGKDGVYRLKKTIRKSAEVLVRIRQERGYYGCNAFLEPVRFVQGRGALMLPLNREREGLKFYSGGIRLRKQVDWEKAGRLVLDLTGLGSAVSIYVNGTKAGSVVAEPYECEITDLMRKGRNDLELVCYNTLYNHMLTVPTNFNYEQSPDWRMDR